MNANDLPGRVRDERKKRGWTQRELAERAGVSLRTYQNFEARTGSPQGANLQAILAAVDMSGAQEGIAEATREELPRDTKIFFDMLAAYLIPMDDEERLEEEFRITRDISERRRPV